MADSFSDRVPFNATASSYGAGTVMDQPRVIAIGPDEGGDVMITSARLTVNETALQSGETSYNLHLYRSLPTAANHTDTSTWDLTTAEQADHIGTISLGTPVDLGSTCKVEVDGINKQVMVPPGGKLWAELVTVGAHTSLAVAHTVSLHSVRL